MSTNKSRVITLTLPEGLLVQIDVLAKKDFATRSDILRQAALAYVRQSDLVDEEVKKLVPRYSDQRPIKSKPEPKPARDYGQIVKDLKPEHPYAHLYDKELLAFLDDHYNKGL